MNKVIAAKLNELPLLPGVYFHKDAEGQIIYIGKAANLRNRVRQYFQVSRSRDPKTEALVMEIADIDWVTVETEIDALLLEAELVRRYLPRYNILLRDDKSSLYVRISYRQPHPTVTFVRRPLDDGARYFGPFWNGREIRQALHILRRIFPYSTHTGPLPKRACLQYHLGLCPGLEEHKTSLEEYRANLRRLMHYLKGDRIPLMSQIESDMKAAAKKKEFERATTLRNQLYSLKTLSQKNLFLHSESLDISKDRGLQGLTDLLGLNHVPRHIEGYDISHMQGSHNVASMVVFRSGVPDKAGYRKFRMRLPGNNDFGHMEEVITRRLSEKNRNAWGLPDLFLIDGGKGQLSSAIKARDSLSIDRPMIGLAKREEEIVVDLKKSHVAISEDGLQKLSAYTTYSGDFLSILLPKDADIVKLLQRIRDESHRFAVSYHMVLRAKHQIKSVLDDIPGIGPMTRKKLLRAFGSKQAIVETPEGELAKVVGEAKATIIKRYIGK